jgi:hypothetical protein
MTHIVELRNCRSAELLLKAIPQFRNSGFEFRSSAILDLYV